MDVLWFRLSRRPSDPGDPIGRFDAGRIFIMLNRGDYWQCGFVIPKGSRDQLQGRGLPAFRDAVAQLAPFMTDRVGELHDWEPIKLLTVQVDRLRRWYHPGLLCIGDAAHAMSPVGGVGINLAIQDAVAASNLLAAPLRDGRLTTEDLCRVQQRREWPTRMTQRVQLAIQNRVIRRALSGSDKFSPPFAIRLLALVPFLRRIPARMIGLGFRPEHVHTTAMGVANLASFPGILRL
jgi:2-polyprenyl-6-methoxyphenol hydroxylase-like FAD-dependent oxidoreductase